MGAGSPPPRRDLGGRILRISVRRSAAVITARRISTDDARRTGRTVSHRHHLGRGRGHLARRHHPSAGGGTVRRRTRCRLWCLTRGRRWPRARGAPGPTAVGAPPSPESHMNRYLHLSLPDPRTPRCGGQRARRSRTTDWGHPKGSMARSSTFHSDPPDCRSADLGSRRTSRSIHAEWSVAYHRRPRRRDQVVEVKRRRTPHCIGSPPTVI